MYYLLFIVYLLVCCYFTGRNRFIKQSGLPLRVITGLFLLRIATGIFSGYMLKHYYGLSNDSWTFNLNGWSEYHLLMSDPKKFILGIGHSNYNTYNNFFGSEYSYWNDLRELILLKILAILDIFTRGNYYINTLFINVAGFFGSVAIYRIFSAVYTAGKRAALIGSFLLPSTLLFTSIILKDVLIFWALGIFCYALYGSIEKKLTRNRSIILLLSFIFLLLMRSYIALVIVPAAVAWLICKRYNRPAIVFSLVLILGLTGITILQFTGTFNAFELVTGKHAAFMALGKAQTDLPPLSLQPYAGSFVSNMPAAVEHAFLRPHLFEFKQSSLIILSIEVLAYVFLFLLMLIFYKKQSAALFPWFSISLALAGLLLIGYIVPNAGAIIRYRCIFLPYLLIPVFAHINFQKYRRRKYISR